MRIPCVEGADACCACCFLFCEVDDFVIRAFPCTAAAVGFPPLPGGRPRGRFGDEVSAPFVAAGCALGGRPRGRFGG